MKISVAIPCYEMHGRGGEFLAKALESIATQDHPSVEVVVSDHSRDAVVEAACARYADRLNLRYLRNAEKRGSSSANTNNAMRACTGELIKILCQDDMLLGSDALSRTVKAFTPQTHWLLSDYMHMRDGAADALFDRRVPWLNGQIEIYNSVGTHSCLTVRNGEIPLFDEALLWFMDCEYYRKLYERYGSPVFLRETTVAVMLWSGQVTHTSASSEQLRSAERSLLQQRYPTPLPNLRLVQPGPEPSLLQRVISRLRLTVFGR